MFGRLLALGLPEGLFERVGLGLEAGRHQAAVQVGPGHGARLATAPRTGVRVGRKVHVGRGPVCITIRGRGLVRIIININKTVLCLTILEYNF